MALTDNGHYLLVTITSNQFPVSLTTLKDHTHTQLYIMAYTIRGYPTTNGIPNNLYFNLLFDDIPSFGNAEWIRNDNLAGIPLALHAGWFTGFTHEDYNPPRLLRSGTPSSLTRFNLRITDDQNNPAIFDSIVLWLHTK
jgi:hypothetical protein